MERTEWQKYKDLEPYKRLRNEGRELLGNHIVLTVKRDGENVSLWLDEEKNVRISSRRREDAEKDIQSRMKATPEYPKIVEYLNDEYHGKIIMYGELLKGVSPTRIEPRRKHIHWIMFDIYDVENGRYMPYNWMYQVGYHYKIPVVPIVDEFVPETMTEIDEKIEAMKKWCKRHRREGVVGKDYHNQTFFKEKIDLPKRPKIKRPGDSRPQYPPMPEERILRALKHALDEVGEENWKDKRIAMPVVARHIAAEAEEHNYSRPNNFYSYYVNYSVATLQSSKESVKNGV